MGEGALKTLLAQPCQQGTGQTGMKQKLYFVMKDKGVLLIDNGEPRAVAHAETTTIAAPPTSKQVQLAHSKSDAPSLGDADSVSTLLDFFFKTQTSRPSNPAVNTPKLKSTSTAMAPSAMSPNACIQCIYCKTYVWAGISVRAYIAPHC